ncbi:MAG TPA: sugar phosphate isomerase/epimerase [Gaiella sp.]|nr:sugar phosphate isomerase/epimerase [Gaiella sp.]
MSRIGLQLYTVRDAAAADLAGALRAATELGFQGVELHDLHGHAPDEVRAMLDAHGLAVCGRHVGLEAAEDDLGGLVAELVTLGTDRLVVAWIEPPRTPAEADAAVARLVRAAGRAADAGLRLGFHNHDAEVAAQADGRSVLDLLLAADGGPFLELDLGWAWYAGADPIALVDTAGSRAPLVHVKDMRRDGGPVHVPLGRGDVDYKGLADAADRAGVEWLIVEQDETDGDAFEAVAESLARLRSLVEAPA